MGEIVYALCAITSLVCALLLLRGYLRFRTKLLLSCCVCFAGLALNNIVLFIDLVFYPPEVTFADWRNAIALLGSTYLLYNLTMEGN